MINVLGPPFGAVGDRVADDTAALQMALDIAGPEAVDFAGRGYRITAPLIVTGGRTLLTPGAYIFGTGHHSLIRNYYAGVDSYPGYTGNGDITIIGGTWDVRGQECAAEEGYNGMSFSHARNIRVEDVTVRNVAWCHAVEFNGVNWGKAINCRAEGFRDTSSDLSRGLAEGFQVDMAHPGSTGLGPWDNTTARDIEIRGCYMGPSDELGPFGALAGSHTGKTLGVFYDGISVVDCTVEGSLKYAIHGEVWRDPVIRGNHLRGTAGTSIFLDACVAGVVSSNPIRDAGSNGINLTSSHGVLVQVNSITNAAGYGVYVTGCNRANIGANYIDNAGLAGVKLGFTEAYGDVNHALVLGNTFRRNTGGTQPAVVCDGGAGSVNTVSHNDVWSYGTSATVISVLSGTVNKSISAAGSIGQNVA